MSFINPLSGVTGREIVLSITDNTGEYTLNTPMVVPAIVDITIENQNETTAWATLDAAIKHKTVSPGEAKVSGNIVAEQDAFFGDGTTDGVESVGIFGLTKSQSQINFTLFVGKRSDGTGGTTITGVGYINGYSLTSAGDSKWDSPFTIEVDGEMTAVATP